MRTRILAALLVCCVAGAAYAVPTSRHLLMWTDTATAALVAIFNAPFDEQDAGVPDGACADADAAEQLQSRQRVADEKRPAEIGGPFRADTSTVRSASAATRGPSNDRDRAEMEQRDRGLGHRDIRRAPVRAVDG